MDGNTNRCEETLCVVDTAKALCPMEEDMLELPARGTPRWFIPTSSRQARRSGSKIYPAFRWKGRAYRTVLRAWITYGKAHFTHCVSARRECEWPLGDLLLPDIPALSTAAVSIGPPGPGQKITLQLMDYRGQVLGYAKYADKPLTRARLRNEARMLETIPEGVGPRLVRFAPFMEGDLLVQTPLLGRPRGLRLRLDAAQMRLLEKLMQSEGASAASEHPFVRDLHARAGEHTGLLERVVTDLENGEWPVVLMHGDLAPWNMIWRRGDYSAFDWECGVEAGFPYLDTAYTLIQVASLVRGNDPRRAKRTISDLLKRWLPDRHDTFASAIAGLSALYTLVSWYPPSEGSPRESSPQEHWLRTFAQATP